MSKKKIKTEKSPYSQAEYVEVAFYWKVGHKIVGRSKKILYSRGRSTSVYSLENAAFIFAMWDKICCGGTTYMDEALEALEGILPNKSELTVQELIQKYWVPSEKVAEEYFNNTVNSIFYKEWCKKNGITDSARECLKNSTCDLMNHFSRSVLSVKYALLYFIFKYYENSSIDELVNDIHSIPASITEIVDEIVNWQNDRNKERNQTHRE